MNKILVIAAHPDDEIYGMGGTIAKLSSQGKQVHLLIVTDGSTAQYRGDARLGEIINRKKEEVCRAADCVGIKSVQYGGLPDMRLDQTEHIEINQVIEECIEQLQPDTVFTHFWGDVNLDHQRVFQSTVVATRPTALQSVKQVFCYSVPSSTEWQVRPQDVFTPNYFVDIGDYAEQKAAAVNAYASELRAYPHPRSVQAVMERDRSAGLRCGLSLCEEFILVRKVV